MITKEELKKEIDSIPDNLLERAYYLIRKVILQKKSLAGVNRASEHVWKKWLDSFDKFTPDFMETRQQPPNQVRESFD